jgi:hypothetical protein
VLETIEELEELVADPLAIAAAPDAGRDEYTHRLEAVESRARRGWRYSVQRRRALRVHNRLGGQSENDLASNRICTRRSRALDELAEEGIDLSP